MSGSQETNGSVDEDLEAAFDWDGDGGEEQVQEGNGRADAAAEPGGNNGDDDDELDYDALADEAFGEVEQLKHEHDEPEATSLQQNDGFPSAKAPYTPPCAPPTRTTGPSEPPAKRQRVSFQDMTPSPKPRGQPGGCAHPIWVFGLCGVCAKSKEEAEAEAEGADQFQQYLGDLPNARAQQQQAASGTVRLRHLHANAAVEVSADEAQRVRRETVTRMLAQRRLILILDLDHTLLNSVRLMEVTDELLPKLAAIQQREQEAGLGPHCLLHCLRECNLWTKLRPGVFEFLQGLRDLYELHIYTMGDKHYAAAIRRLLDPDAKLFRSVIAKDHSTASHAKDLDVLLSADELALIIDDTAAVWPGHARNLLQIERYHFFPSDLRKWRAGGLAYLERDADESAEEGALATYMRVLKDVHTTFFGESRGLPPLAQRDVRHVLSELRGATLRGCHITFTLCWPQGRDARNEPLWQLAESLGARCSTNYEQGKTTHVVAAGDGTNKVHIARSHGKAVVGPAWLYACMHTWRRMPEADFPIPAKAAQPPSAAAAAATAAAGGAAPMSEAEELQRAIAAAGGGGGGGGAPIS